MGFWGFGFFGFCLGWGSPGNGRELFFVFVSSFFKLKMLLSFGTFWLKSDPLSGVWKNRSVTSHFSGG